MKSFLQKDYDKWATYWPHTDYLKRFEISAYSYQEISGWDSVNAMMKNYFTANTPNQNIEKNNFDIRINKYVAIIHVN